MAGLLTASNSANAVPIEVYASGTIHEGYDYANELGLGVGSLDGRTVTATWTYDSDYLPDDYYMGIYPDFRWYNEPGVFTQWIITSVLIEGSANPLEEFAYPGGHDYLEVGDGDIPSISGVPSGRDSYGINSNSSSVPVIPGPGVYLDSRASFWEIEDDLIHGLSGYQVFDWADNDATDGGHGAFRLSSGAGTSVYGLYTLDSMSARVRVL